MNRKFVETNQKIKVQKFNERKEKTLTPMETNFFDATTSPPFCHNVQKIERIGSKEIPTRFGGSGDDEKIRRALEHDEGGGRLEE